MALGEDNDETMAATSSLSSPDLERPASVSAISSTSASLSSLSASFGSSPMNISSLIAAPAMPGLDLPRLPSVRSRSPVSPSQEYRLPPFAALTTDRPPSPAALLLSRSWSSSSLVQQRLLIDRTVMCPQEQLQTTQTQTASLLGIPSATVTFASSTSSSPSTPTLATTSSRRPKPHVMAACFNCKKAHLACDGTFSFYFISFSTLFFFFFFWLLLGIPFNFV
ncbi:hypothetical protein V1514DRAFT_332743, partial [Lipomyces japonicus]|uniref:uncharacterized protein n=1 Tax=Lipomyces japonicus TaxID=56871 RepID=UPI0034CDFD2A